MNQVEIFFLYVLMLLTATGCIATGTSDQNTEIIQVSWADDQPAVILIDGFELHFNGRQSVPLQVPVEQDLSLEVRTADEEQVYSETVLIKSGTYRLHIRLVDGDEEEPSSGQQHVLRVNQQIMPVMLGGIDSLYKNLEYPRDAVSNDHEGIAYIGFIVNTKGRVENARVETSTGYTTLDSAALRAVERLRFEPGTVNGNLVRVKLTQPVTFRLQ